MAWRGGGIAFEAASLKVVLLQVLVAGLTKCSLYNKSIGHGHNVHVCEQICPHYFSFLPIFSRPSDNVDAHFCAVLAERE